eukprot:4537803-Amphidinium_carterae.1
MTRVAVAVLGLSIQCWTLQAAITGAFGSILPALAIACANIGVNAAARKFGRALQRCDSCHNELSCKVLPERCVSASQANHVSGSLVISCEL